MTHSKSELSNFFLQTFLNLKSSGGGCSAFVTDRSPIFAMLFRRESLSSSELCVARTRFFVVSKKLFSKVELFIKFSVTFDVRIRSFLNFFYKTNSLKKHCFSNISRSKNGFDTFSFY